MVFLVMRIYADTSIFGGYFDVEFAEATKRFFEDIDRGRFLLVSSAVVATEIEPAPDKVRNLFFQYAAICQTEDVSSESLILRGKYIEAGIVTTKSLDDALHVAIATVTKCDIIVSWNFKHIVHFDKIKKYNAVNLLHGYGPIGIYSPLEVIDYDE